MTGVTLPKPPASYGSKWTYQDTLTLTLATPALTELTNTQWQMLWTASEQVQPDHRWAVRRVMVPYNNYGTTQTFLLAQSPPAVLSLSGPSPPPETTMFAAGGAVIDLASPVVLDEYSPALEVLSLYTFPTALSVSPIQGTRCLIQYDDFLQG